MEEATAQYGPYIAGLVVVAVVAFLYRRSKKKSSGTGTGGGTRPGTPPTEQK